MAILNGELTRQFDIKTVYERVAMAHGEPVQLGDKKGVVYRKSKEQEALERWTKRQFLDVERNIAKQWRRSLTALISMRWSSTSCGILARGARRKLLKMRNSLPTRSSITWTPNGCCASGLIYWDLPGAINVPNAADIVIADWIQRRRPPLREHVPYFVFLLTVNIFFCLVLPTQLLRNVKASHQVDLAYLYYLPFCSVFTSKGNFHAQIVPLFLDPHQTFVNGIDFKEDLKKLDAYYSAMPEEVLKTGLINFAGTPPDDTSFLITRLWDKYLPAWRDIKAAPKKPRDPEADKKLIEELNQMSDSPDLKPHDERDPDKINYVTIIKDVKVRKGKWQRFSEEQEQRMRDQGLLR